MRVNKSTAVLIVDAIEPSLPFWQKSLGFERPVEVPLGNSLGFVILTNGAIEVMYQTVASVATEMPSIVQDWHRDKSHLYVDVDDIEAVAAALDGFEIVLPKRKTFYGAIEVGFREPGGHFITFAQAQN